MSLLARSWADLPLRRKGLLMVAIPLLALLMSTLALYASSRRSASVQDAAERESRKGRLARGLLITVLDAETSVRGHLLTGEEAFLRRYDLGRTAAGSQLAQLSLEFRDSRYREEVATIEMLVNKRLRILTRLGTGLPPEPRHRVLLQGQTVGEVLRRELDDLIALSNLEAAAVRRDAARSERFTMTIAAISVPIGLLGGFLAMSLFASGVVRRVQRLERNAGQLASGESLDALPPGDDEVGRVGEAMVEASKLLSARERERDRFFTMSSDLLGIADFQGRMVRLNPAWGDVLGWDADVLISKPLLDFVHPDDRERTGVLVERLREGGTAVGFENRFRHRDGSYRWLLWAARADEETRLLYAAARDITLRKQQEHELEVQALVDQLTGLKNRRGLLLLAEQQLRVAARTRQPTAVLFVDLDGMKGINDTHGHAEGDRALCDTSEILRSTLRGADV
ncbi:MAG: diguanylate cyclase, partial [Actinomycetota bacterium]|nr:diguanylate cyclase [Actinomycetota bacterium]